MKRLARFGVFVALVLFSVALEPDQPLNDDMRFYVPAAASYATWVTSAWNPASWSRAAIDRAFTLNHEHPPVGKYVMGAGWLVFYHWTGLTSEVTACRLPIIMLWAWTCMMLFAWVRREASVLAALATVGCFIVLPRVLFDAHAETLDFAVTAFLVAASESLLRAMARPQWPTVARTVVMHALALGTKLNTPFAIAAEVVDWLCRDRPKRRGLDIMLAPVPIALVLVLVVAPIVTLAMWPWLWFDTGKRLDAYFDFHLHHYGILFYFGGTLYSDQPAPWYAPLTMLTITTPVVTLTLALIGLLTRSPLRRFATLQIAAQLVAVSLPDTPKYGGVKLFLPVFPYICVLAGLGFARAADELTRPWARHALLAACLAPSLVGVLVYRGYWLSYYNEIIGGVRGATRSGFERQYYDLAYPALHQALDRAVPAGGRVAVLPNPKEYGPYFQRWGFRLADPQTAQVIVITHERRWSEYPEIEARYRTLERIETIRVAGVPLASLYRPQ